MRVITNTQAMTITVRIPDPNRWDGKEALKDNNTIPVKFPPGKKVTVHESVYQWLLAHSTVKAYFEKSIFVVDAKRDFRGTTEPHFPRGVTYGRQSGDRDTGDLANIQIPSPPKEKKSEQGSGVNGSGAGKGGSEVKASVNEGVKSGAGVA